MVWLELAEAMRMESNEIFVDEIDIAQDLGKIGRKEVGFQSIMVYTYFIGGYLD